MRYSVRKSGVLAARGHWRATVEDALDLALEMLNEAGPREVVTLEDSKTGLSYRGTEIIELRKTVCAKRDGL